MSAPRRVVLAGSAVTTASAEAIDLMEAAAREAIEVASGARMGVDVIVIPAGTWPYGDPGRELARRLGSPGATTILGQLGVSQQELLNISIQMIERGDARSVLVVGGESRRWASAGTYSTLAGGPDRTLERPESFLDDLEIEAGLAFPAVRSYALIERAFDAVVGLTDLEADLANAALWSAMSAVAAQQADSLVDAPVPPEEVATTSARNRLLAAPYRRLHASQWTVDHAAALVLTERDAARASGADPSAVVHPLVALESTHAVPVIQRVALGRWPAMQLLGEVAAAHLGRPLSEIDLVDLYSCFPVAVRLQAMELGIATEPAPTITGGMTFAGGPFNNYVLGATATMADRLRQGAATTGLVTTVSGLLTKPGLAVWGSDEPAGGALVADLAPAAALRTAATPCDLLDEGAELTIEATTAWFDGDQPTAAILGRDARGRRRLVLRHDDASVSRFAEHASIGEQL